MLFLIAFIFPAKIAKIVQSLLLTLQFLILKNVNNKHFSHLIFIFSPKKQYLCTRFPRNRWQEDRRVACYVALERYNKFNLSIKQWI